MWDRLYFSLVPGYLLPSQYTQSLLFTVIFKFRRGPQKLGGLVPVFVTPSKISFEGPTLSNGVVRLTTCIRKNSCCLYSVKIFCIGSDSIFKGRSFFEKCFHVFGYNTLD